MSEYAEKLEAVLAVDPATAESIHLMKEAFALATNDDVLPWEDERVDAWVKANKKLIIATLGPSE